MFEISTYWLLWIEGHYEWPLMFSCFGLKFDLPPRIAVGVPYRASSELAKTRQRASLPLPGGKIGEALISKKFENIEQVSVFDRLCR
jgi:hypothetical protein